MCQRRCSFTPRTNCSLNANAPKNVECAQSVRNEAAIKRYPQDRYASEEVAHTLRARAAATSRAATALTRIE